MTPLQKAQRIIELHNNIRSLEQSLASIEEARKLREAQDRSEQS